MFCNKCGKELEPSAKFCKYCGANANNDSIKKENNENNVKVKTKTNNKKLYQQWWFWTIIIIILVIIGGTVGTDTAQTVSNKTNNVSIETEEEKAKKESDFKNECKKYTFEELARNPEKIKGKKVKLTGQVIQTYESSWSSSVDLRINITKNEYGFYSDVIYATYILPNGTDKILEDDIITIWGTAEGDYSYTSVLGTKVTLPKINVKYIEIKNK